MAETGILMKNWRVQTFCDRRGHPFFALRFKYQGEWYTRSRHYIEPTWPWFLLAICWHPRFFIGHVWVNIFKRPGRIRQRLWLLSQCVGVTWGHMNQCICDRRA